MTPTPNSTDLSFLQKCTAVKVSFGNLRSAKKLPKSAVTTESDPNRVNASKKLWECAEANAIKDEFTRLRKFVTSRTLPSPFGKGIYFVPNTLLGEIDAELTISATQTLPTLAEALIAVYADVMMREAEALGPNYNPTDYESPAEIRARLKVNYFYTIFGVPENLPNAMYKREQEKAQSKLSEAVGTMQALLRAEMDKLLKHAVDALSGKYEKTGKPKIFRGSLTGNIRKFLKLFKDRDITDDTELQAICDQVNELLKGVDPADLRKQEPLRESTAKAFAQIREKLDAMMVAKGTRNIVFEDDEEAEAA